MKKSVLFKNIPVSFTDQGKGTAVVFLHGFLENSRMWSPIIEGLKTPRRVVCMDLLGHGETPSLGYIHRMDDMAEQVHRVCTSLRLKRIVLIGHSMGGYVALAFAKQYPEMVKGLCLVNSTPFSDSKERLLLREKMIRVVNKNNYKSIVDTLVTGLFNPETLSIHKEAIALTTEDAVQVSLQSFVATQKGMMEREDHRSMFGFMPIAKTVILGKKDSLIDPGSLTQYLSEHAISYTLLPDGHMSHLENTQGLITALNAFLKLCP